MSILLSIITGIADFLTPLAGASATAAAIVTMIALVRLLLHPLSRAAIRGEQARSKLAPRMAELQKKHANDRHRLAEEASAMYRDAGTSPVAGCLPMLVQLPVFFVLYQLFTSSRIGGEPNALLAETLFGAKLGGNFGETVTTGQLFAAPGLVYICLFVVVALAATAMFLRMRRNQAATVPKPLRLLPLLSYGTILAVAIVPLAAGLYLATTTLWTAVEQALLRRRPSAQPANDGAPGSRHADDRS